jgi:hypothetical protein
MSRVYILAGILGACLVSGSSAIAGTASAGTAPSATKIATAKPAAHKAAHRGVRTATKYHYKTYFVPPPPAIMPSILPELTARRMQGYDDAIADEAEKKAENPYNKYIRTPDGEAPAPLATRKGVVIWAKRG